MKALVFAVGLFVLGQAGQVEAQKIGVVDMLRALNETEDGRKAKSRLKTLTEKRQKSLDKQQKDLLALKESIEKQKDVLTREVLAKKAEEYQRTALQLQSTMMDFQRELAAKEEELTDPILNRMKTILRRIGQAEGYAMIVDRNAAGVVFVPSSYDLTDVLIQRYNAGDGKGKGKAKAKGKGKAKAKKK
ncbi:MAG: OmpH family outer membrane protein [Myxococcales bacterium]|nr:OmpH family outer membrane protein [Myxococcales bacterium]